MKLLLLIPGAILMLWFLWKFVQGLTSIEPSGADVNGGYSVSDTSDGH